MASYRFCRSEDIPLLVRAYNTCYAAHFPGTEFWTPARFKQAAREIDLWASNCMVAVERDEPIAVVLATKRESACLVHSIGVHPDRVGQGHGRHILTSLSQKLAILGPRRIVCELAEAHAGVRGYFEACGYEHERTLTDYRRVPTPGGDEEHPVRGIATVTVGELKATDALGPRTSVCWERANETLINRAVRIRGLAIASGERFEAWLLFEEHDEARSILALGDAGDAVGRRCLDRLVRHFCAADGRPVVFSAVDASETDGESLAGWGFVPGPSTDVLVAAAAPA